jgi:hypothetical protein
MDDGCQVNDVNGCDEFFFGWRWAWISCNCFQVIFYEGTPLPKIGVDAPLLKCLRELHC